MATALWPLQAAIFTKLNAVPALAGRVFSDLPETSAYPCVQIGSMFELPDDTHDAQGLETVVTIHVWSISPSNSEMAAYFKAVDDALDRVPLTVAGFTEVGIKRTSSQVIPDPDPDVKHINAQYRVTMTKE